jgi:hypothetical protein
MLGGLQLFLSESGLIAIEGVKETLGEILSIKIG